MLYLLNLFTRLSIHQLEHVHPKYRNTTQGHEANSSTEQQLVVVAVMYYCLFYFPLFLIRCFLYSRAPGEERRPLGVGRRYEGKTTNVFIYMAHAAV